jgi:hypothetical protein
VCVLQVFDYSKKLAESSIHKCKAILSRTVGETVLRQVNAGSSETRAPMSEVTGGVAGGLLLSSFPKSVTRLCR